MDDLDIDTPSVVIDLDIVDANITKFQAYCDKQGLHLRPHVKTHKIPALAKQQLAAGAAGITCQKITEAEAMISEGGIDDILLTYNVLGKSKLRRLRQLAQKVRLSVVADNITCIKGLSETFQDAQTPLTVLVECDTGALRCGVISADEALELAQAIDRLPGIRFGGLMTYPPIGHADHINSFLEAAKSLIEASGLVVDVVSIGGSPDMWRADQIPVGTEYRIGTYIYNDRSLIMRGTCEIKDCALTILATVVSTPTPNRAVIDAGSKSLTSDL
ncbi:MAG: D-TA family PLP-dependent enzyme, partial [Marinovum sp.]|nr:D-TA family PLP-dependent enzyme [Marinovum sp.]